jgi:hypothetical protein
LSKSRVQVIIGTGWYGLIANLHDHHAERGRGMGLLGIDESAVADRATGSGSLNLSSPL